MPSSSFSMADGLRTDVSDGVYPTFQKQPVRRARLQKKSVQKLNQAESLPPIMDQSSGFLAHRRHKSASAMFFGSSSTNTRVQIIPSMSSAGIPRPPQLPVEYQNPKLMSDSPAIPERPRGYQDLQRTSDEQAAASGCATEQTGHSSTDFELSLRVRRFQRTSGPFGSRLRSASNSVAEPSFQRPSTAHGPTRSAVRMASAPVLSAQAKPEPRFECDAVTEEEPCRRERRKSSASSCYSTLSEDSASSAVWGLDHVRSALLPIDMNEDLAPNPFIEDTKPDSEATHPFPDVVATPEDVATPRPQSRQSAKDWSGPRLSAIPSEPGSRFSKEDSIVNDDHRGSVTGVGIQATPRGSDANLAQACQQLEEQLEVVSERIHAKEQASEMNIKLKLSRNDDRKRHSQGRTASPSFSSSSRSSPHSESGVSSIETPMTEFSPTSFEPNYPKSTLSRSNSIFNLLEDSKRRSASIKIREETDALIDASSATQVIYHILEALPDLSSLFSAALISRGFYQVFKAHELRLIKQVVRRMSPALWEICELSQATGNFLALDDHTGPINRTPTSLYLRDYDLAMYTVVALKVMIPDRCRGLLRDDELAHFLCEADEERAARLDTAIWRIWTFCSTFGCHTGREQDLAAQKSWLGGGASKSNKLNGKKSGYGLSGKEIKDVLEVWNALYSLLRSLNLKVADAKHVGLIAHGTPDQYAQPLLDEWLHYVLSLGPRAVLDLASTWPSTSFATMQKAKFKGWTDWRAPEDGTTMATFLHEAATRLHVEAVLSETRDMSFSLPARAANRTASRSVNTTAQPNLHKKSKSDSSPLSRAGFQLPSRTRSATTARSNDRMEPPRIPLRSQASSSSTQSNESKVLQWKQTVGPVKQDEKRLSATKALPNLPVQPKQSSVTSFDMTSTASQPDVIQAADEMIKWSLLAAGPASPRLAAFNRPDATHRSPVEPQSPHHEEWQHPAYRLNSLTSSNSGLSPLVEFGEGQFALPYNPIQDVKPAPHLPIVKEQPAPVPQPPQRQYTNPAPSVASVEFGSSQTSDRSRASEENVSETISRGISTRRRRPTSSIFDVRLRSSKKEKRKSSAQFLAHMSEACEMHGLC